MPNCKTVEDMTLDALGAIAQMLARIDLSLSLLATFASVELSKSSKLTINEKEVIDDIADRFTNEMLAVKRKHEDVSQKGN